MPNWAEGVLKIRGKKENIIKFAKENITGVNGWKIQNFDHEKKTYELGQNDDFNVEIKNNSLIIKDTMDTHIGGTRRMFIQQSMIDWYLDDEETQTVNIYVQQAWGIIPDNLKELSKKYGLDFRIYAFEMGMQFNQEVEVIKGEITVDKVIYFKDYEWECINPNLGG